MREKELTKNNDRLAVITTCNRITILPNKSIEVEGHLDKEMPCKSTPSIIQSTDLAEHKDISTETTLLNYNYKENGTIAVRLSNLTRGTITIPQKAIICEVQPITIEAYSTPNFGCHSILPMYKLLINDSWRIAWLITT
jgi:hypothetical protein